jgi:hypothetical protein
MSKPRFLQVPVYKKVQLVRSVRHSDAGIALAGSTTLFFSRLYILEDFYPGKGLNIQIVLHLDLEKKTIFFQRRRCCYEDASILECPRKQ